MVALKQAPEKRTLQSRFSIPSKIELFPGRVLKQKQTNKQKRTKEYQKPTLCSVAFQQFDIMECSARVYTLPLSIKWVFLHIKATLQNKQTLNLHHFDIFLQTY